MPYLQYIYVAFSISILVHFSFSYSAGSRLKIELDQGSSTLKSQNYVPAQVYKSPLLGINFSDHATVIPLYPLARYIGSSRWGVYIGLQIQLMWFYVDYYQLPQSDSIALTMLSVQFNIQFQHVINLVIAFSLVMYNIFSILIMFKLYPCYLCFGLFMLLFSFILSCKLSNFQVQTHTLRYMFL